MSETAKEKRFLISGGALESSVTLFFPYQHT